MRNELNLTPTKFYSLIEIIKEMQSSDKKIESFEDELNSHAEELNNYTLAFDRASRVISHEHRRTSVRRPSALNALDMAPDLEETNSDTFIDVGYKITQVIQSLYERMGDITTNLRPGHFMLSTSRYDHLTDAADLQKLIYEMELNTPTLTKNINALLELRDCKKVIADTAEVIQLGLEKYHKKLVHRHTVEGVHIHRDPIVTDIAMVVYENVDASGEIAEGKNPDELSHYSINKATLLARTVKDPAVNAILFDPDMLVKFTIGYLGTLRQATESLRSSFIHQINEMQNILGGKYKKRDTLVVSLDFLFQSIQDLNPAEITSQDKERMLTREERFALAFQNETIAKISDLLVNEENDPKDVIDYVLGRKAELRKFFHEENSFYVCQIGSGNPFSGEAPGALKVIPGQRPLANLDEITGSGFAEVKDFIQSIEETAKFHNLFLATSPSKTADKANVLLIGPPGCLGSSSFVRYEVRKKDGSRSNHKGGSIERLWRRFNDKQGRTPIPAWLPRDSVDFFVPSVDEATGLVFQNRVFDVVQSGIKPCYCLTVDTGESLCVTHDHEFYLGEGQYRSLRDLKDGDGIMGQEFPSSPLKKQYHRRPEILVRHHPNPDIPVKTVAGKYKYARLTKYRAIVEADMNGLSLGAYVDRLNQGELEGLSFLTSGQHVHHIDNNPNNNELSNLKVISSGDPAKEHGCHDPVASCASRRRITSIEFIGEMMTYDIKVEGPNHNFVSEGLVVHNCGKSEILRAVGSDKESVGIFAQGSDFLTCWKGEAEKNPKRLFEEGLRISKEAKRRVHFLIDEIDAVLNDDRDFSSTNLTLEFQILMDGVVHYPNLSVWGATNFPQRIPHAMLRRFNKVLIVGELTQGQRVKLLKQFVEGYLPTNIKQEAWEDAAMKLDGAVGDIIRKVGDYLWRDKLGTFVRVQPKIAQDVVSSLSEDGRFNLAEFDAKSRATLKKRLAPHATVTSLDLTNAVNHLTGNLAIRQEITTAVTTYEEAHRLTANLNDAGQKERSSKRPPLSAKDATISIAALESDEVGAQA